MVVLYIVIYFVLLDIYFEAINRLHEILRDHRFYIEFGHASILLLLVFAICFFSALIIIITIPIQRVVNKKRSIISIEKL